MKRMSSVQNTAELIRGWCIVKMNDIKKSVISWCKNALFLSAWVSCDPKIGTATFVTEALRVKVKHLYYQTFKGLFCEYLFFLFQMYCGGVQRQKWWLECGICITLHTFITTNYIIWIVLVLERRGGLWIVYLFFDWTDKLSLSKAKIYHKWFVMVS